MKRNARAGFTMIEVMIATAVTIMIFGFLYQVLYGSQRLSSTTLSLGRVEEAGSQATLAMTSEIRWADPTLLLISTEAGSSRLDFRVVDDYVGGTVLWSSMITYRYEPSPVDWDGNGVLDEGTLTRTQDGDTRVICRRVGTGGLVITQDEDTVSIQLTLFATDDDGLIHRRSVQTFVTLMN
ncbi:MAG: prepilin-type N-terminal cleavage/methylation domain-containing protein [Planctomycetota bacterium]|nr:MAG: prepilin-type N-terminal cleavage/methylation domain-containing protein [Planctomycetota bacterium]